MFHVFDSGRVRIIHKLRAMCVRARADYISGCRCQSRARGVGSAVPPNPKNVISSANKCALLRWYPGRGRGHLTRQERNLESCHIYATCTRASLECHERAVRVRLPFIHYCGHPNLTLIVALCSLSGRNSEGRATDNAVQRGK